MLYDLYVTMLRTRRFEERVLELLLQGKLASTMCHVGIGQEAKDFSKRGSGAPDGCPFAAPSSNRIRIGGDDW